MFSVLSVNSTKAGRRLLRSYLAVAQRNVAILSRRLTLIDGLEITPILTGQRKKTKSSVICMLKARIGEKLPISCQLGARWAAE